MTKLDWTKGYTADPARVLADSSPTYSRPTGSLAKATNFWAQALKRLNERKRSTISQKALLEALGVSRQKQKGSSRGLLLRKFVRTGILLGDGQPNLSDPRVQKIIAQIAKQRDSRRNKAAK